MTMAAEECNTGLSLALGVGEYKRSKDNNKHAAAARACKIDLSFTLCPKDEDGGYESNISNNINNICSRKKLRLTKEQSSLLEDSFKLHTTLNSSQKHELAEQLNLKPRQVEVWFQNRRARTKLKQTEVDCEFLKRSCESLTDENKRLKKELQSIKGGSSPLFIQLQKATTCPSCQKIYESKY